MNSYVEVRGVRLGEGRPKICVPLVGKNEEGIYEQARKLCRTPADMAEWRADWFDGLYDSKRLLTVLQELRRLLGERPLLFTIRTAQEGGEKELTPKEYESINLLAARSGWVDLVDVEVFRMSIGEAEELLLGETEELFLGEAKEQLLGEAEELFLQKEGTGNLERKERDWKERGRKRSVEQKGTCREKRREEQEQIRNRLQEGVYAGKELAHFLQRPYVSQLVRDLRETKVPVIGSSHDFSCTPGTLFMVHCLRAMQELGVDLCKLAVMPGGEEDVVRLLQATWQMKTCFGDRPLITMSMGNAGVISRVAGELYGSALTFGTAGQASAPGQVEARKLAEALELLHVESKNPGHIFLIGFMGTGKSTVAFRLQELLGRERIEMDAGIEQQEGQRITELFARYGEAYFREKETAYLRSLGTREPAVISCGGGVVVREENTSFMKGCGKIVLLTASPQTVLERVGESQERPILNGNMNVEYIGQLMEKRRELYEAAADFIVATDGKDVDAICREILEGIQS